MLTKKSVIIRLLNQSIYYILLLLLVLLTSKQESLFQSPLLQGSISGHYTDFGYIIMWAPNIYSALKSKIDFITFFLKKMQKKHNILQSSKKTQQNMINRACLEIRGVSNIGQKRTIFWKKKAPKISKCFASK